MCKSEGNITWAIDWKADYYGWDQLCAQEGSEQDLYQLELLGQ